MTAAPWMPWTLGLLVAVCVAAVFLPVLSNGYVWDDHMYFGAYPADVYFASWWQNGREPFSISANYFRPVAMLTFLGDFAVGPDPAASHLINLACHALNAALVGLLAWRFLDARIRAAATWIPLAAGLWYGLHPALIESAAMVMCRFDLIATACSLLLLHVSLMHGRWVLPGITLLFLAALLSKESAAGLLVVWPFWAAAVAGLQARRHGPPTAAPLLQGWMALGAGMLLCVLARLWARGYAWLPGDAALFTSDWFERVAMSLAQQIRLMVLPFGAVDPFHTPVTFSHVSYLIASLAVGAAAFGLVRPATRPWAALFVAALAALGPSSNVMPIPFGGNVYTADRYLTLPLVFVAPLIAGALQWVWQRPVLMRCMAGSVLLAWLAGSVAVIRSTLPLLQDDVRFWSWVVQLHPEEAVARNNLADALIADGRPAEAIPLLAQALATNGDNAALWHNLARALGAVGDLALAAAHIDRAIAVDPDQVRLWHTKAALLARGGDVETAERIIRERVLAVDPGMLEAHLNLVRLLLATGRSAEAAAWVDAHRDVLVGDWRHQALELIAGHEGR